MIISERIQAFIHKLEVESGSRWMNYLALMLAVVALAVRYDTHCYLNFSAPEAMDAAQVARNVAEGKGFTTEFIRPFDIYLLQKHHHAPVEAQVSGTNVVDYARVYGPHPDLANPPLYPLVLAGLFKLSAPDWKLEMHKPFWSDGGNFRRYKPEFGIAIFNQALFLVAVSLTFLLAKSIFDMTAAWLAAMFMLYSDTLWKISVSGLPVMLLLVIFLGLVWCLVSFEARGHLENPDPRRRFLPAIGAGFLIGLGMLTRYSFGWLIVPVAAYFLIFGGARRTWLAVAAILVFAVTVLPWIVRNFEVSGTLFGTAGYAVTEDTFVFPGSNLMQSLTPTMSSAHLLTPYLHKLLVNLRFLVQEEVPRLGGGLVGSLFLAGLLLGLRKVVARRLRYFTMMCLGVFLIVSAMGQTYWNTLAPGMNTENLLVLLAPLAVIFGVAFFLTLLDQMKVPSLPIRYLVIALVVLLVRLSFILTLLQSKTSPGAYPPYYPPDIQKFSAWMQPNELMMSDVPWAVAWYGDRPCTWTTLNCQYEFYELNDFIKPVNALYLTTLTLDSSLISDYGQSPDSWANFTLNIVMAERVAARLDQNNQNMMLQANRPIVINPLPEHFPLKIRAPLDATGILLTDRHRWTTQ